MSELLNNAWIGWQTFISAGKLAALLGAALFFLWIFYRKSSRKSLLIYGTVLTVCCVVPVTAVGFMLYQTKFYDYQWIWSFVPMTVLIAYGAICFFGERKGDWRLVVSLMVVLLLCSGMGNTPMKSDASAQERANAKAVLQQLRERKPEGDICLWAPREIMEYTREADASIRLLYGRNMWDEWLNAYCYDTYPAEIEELYEWMETPAEIVSETTSGSDEQSGAVERVQAAVEAGVNCIVLPADKGASEAEALEELLDSPAQEYGGYYFWVR